MSEQPLEKPSAAEVPAEPASEQSGSTASASPGEEVRLVPVTEAIRYRRRAQQAEGHLREVEQQLEAAQSRIQQRDDELATAEAQRDEASTQLVVVENRLAAERLLTQAGVVDLETASVLLSRRLDLAEEVDAEALARGVEQLLLDKPFLRSPGTARGASLPPKTASPRDAAAAPAARLAQAAELAARSGDRRDVADYLRLRRRASTA